MTQRHQHSRYLWPAILLCLPLLLLLLLCTSAHIYEPGAHPLLSPAWARLQTRSRGALFPTPPRFGSYGKLFADAARPQGGLHGVSCRALPAGLEAADLIKIFGRLGDKEYVLENVEKTVASGYGFASYTSARPKWIVCYDKRSVTSEDCGERTQTAKWKSLFADNEILTKEEFSEKLTGLRFAFPLGPGFVDIRPNDPPSSMAVESFWNAIAGDSSEIQKDQFQDTLKSWSADGGETILWEQFTDIFEE